MQGRGGDSRLHGSSPLPGGVRAPDRGRTRSGGIHCVGQMALGSAVAGGSRRVTAASPDTVITVWHSNSGVAAQPLL